MQQTIRVVRQTEDVGGLLPDYKSRIVIQPRTIRGIDQYMRDGIKSMTLMEAVNYLNIFGWTWRGDNGLNVVTMTREVFWTFYDHLVSR